MNIQKENFRPVNVMAPKVTLIIFILTFAVIKSRKVDQAQVDYYANLIDERTQEALQYKWPTDARMHEAKDKNLRGIYTELQINSLYFSSLLLKYIT